MTIKKDLNLNPKGNLSYFTDPQRIISALSPFVTKKEDKELHGAVEHRSLDTGILLENTFDPGNIAAVMRTSEAFGYLPFYILNSHQQKRKTANRVSQGAEKWLNIHLSNTLTSCHEKIKKQGYVLYGTHLDSEKDISEVDFSIPQYYCLWE